MNYPQSIRISDYTYDLPTGKISAFPLEKRDESKLLIYKDGDISESQFLNLSDHLPDGATLVFNDTRVVRARLIFKKPTGARIELFCLDEGLGEDTQLAFARHGSVKWKCLVGNARRWSSGTLTQKIDTANGELILNAEILERVSDGWLINFYWQPGNLSFSEVLEMAGKVPLPPYISREADENDITRYQTIYARSNGSVAAPTAGLHFSKDLFEKIEYRGIRREYLTLHVGAGTFKPVSSEIIGEHQMHREMIIVTKDTILALLDKQSKIFAVGTTSLRTLESLYWFGAKLIKIINEDRMEVGQWDPYSSLNENPVDTDKALQAILKYMDKLGKTSISGFTSLMIVPGYKFHVCQGLITNFHQPQSTLLLLVAAFVGPGWRQVYNYALVHDFRFLSYGDACLFYLNTRC
ncbi:MAG: S-adenosylmethionine:tRNA ribosyltransferase-isomerase [Bacteroidales bacterium]